MLVFAGFLFVGLKTKAGAGQVKAWNMQTNLAYPPMEGHTVGGCTAGPPAPARAGLHSRAACPRQGARLVVPASWAA